MRICVYHPTMGRDIARQVAATVPEARVEIVHDLGADPPSRDEIDVLVANRIPAGLLGRCARLRWLHLTGTGVDHIAHGEPRRDLVVTNSATVPARAVAEFAWMGLLALAKDAVRLVGQQRDRVWRLPESRLVAGSHVVLVGLGRVGTEIARRSLGFDVSVTAVTERGLPSRLVDEVVPPRLLASVAARADHLVVALPDTPRTRHLVGERVIAALPSTAALVNVGRATVVDTDALVRALTERRLRGALIDVHDEEPLPPDSPLWTVDNLWLTPHGAYRFPEEERHVARLFVENLAAFTAGRPLQNRVDLSTALAGAEAVTR